MSKYWQFVKRNIFLLLLVLVLAAGEVALNAVDPVKHMTCLWRTDYELIQLQHPDMTFDRAFYGSSVVIASYIEGQNDSGYANLGVDYGTVSDLLKMLEEGHVTVTGDLVLGLNNISFLDTLPTNAAYVWHREWYEPYLYFHRDRLYQLITDGVGNVLEGQPFIAARFPNQVRAVYYGALSDEELQASREKMLEGYGHITLEDCTQNLADLERLADYCRANGIRLRAVWMPWNSKVGVYPAAQTIIDYADGELQRLGIETLDLIHEVPDEYFYDTGHLDYTRGAPWFTDMIDPWLAEEG